jgi:uncharacterized protein involved in exopolysaccharide biosynthesis
MNNKHTFEAEYFVRFSDLAFLFKKGKTLIATIIVLCIVLGMAYALTRPLEYESNASFRDKGKSHTSVHSSASILLSGSGGSNGGQALSLFKSRKLISNLVKQMHMQAQVIALQTPLSRWSAFREKWRVELAYLFKDQQLSLKTAPIDIQPQDVEYTGVIPTGIKIRFITNDEFQILSSAETLLSTTGKIGVPFSFEKGQFTLVHLSDTPLLNQEYMIVCEPIQDVVKRVSHQIVVEIDKDDKSLIRLYCRSQDKYQAANLLNGLMRVYLEYLHEEQMHILTHQVAYLKERQNEMEALLLQKIHAHADVLSSELILTGFPDAKIALELFTHMQQYYSQQILEIEIGLKKLQQIQDSDKISYTQHSFMGNKIGGNVESVLQIHNLKHQIDLLDLALRDLQTQHKESVQELLSQLKSIKNSTAEAEQLLGALTTNTPLDHTAQLLQDNHYQVGRWVQYLTQAEGEEQQLCKNHLCNYLKHLIHLFHVDGNALEERLTYQQGTPKEFQGITLDTAKELYLTYHKQLSAIETEILEKQFLIEQMKDPHFEISSLSPILTDRISMEVVNRGSTLLLMLQDEANRSLKEQERLKKEIALNKEFITTHIEQAKQLLQIHEKLLHQKITGIQQTTLELLHREVSTLESNFMDQIKSKISELGQDKIIIEAHQKELKENMSQIPKRWISGKMIDYQMDLNKKMVEEITKLVESKNIELNLEVVQSTPIDQAIVETLPRSPRIILFSLLGGIGGALISIGIIIGQAIIAGIPLHQGSLKQTRCHVAGKLSPSYLQNGNLPLQDQDLNTLRQAVTFLIQSAISTQQSTVLILNANAVSFFKDIALLMAKRGLKVLIIPLFFDQKSEGGSGLLQYLENQLEEPEITSGNNYDTLEMGGISRFGIEKLSHPAFKILIERLSKKYDWIIGLSNASINSAEAEALITFFGQIIIPITHENWKDMIEFIHRTTKPISCILSEVSSKNIPLSLNEVTESKRGPGQGNTPLSKEDLVKITTILSERSRENVY